MSLPKALKEARIAYDAIVFYESILCYQRKKWAEGKRKHWQKKRIENCETWLNNAMDQFEAAEKVLEDARNGAGISLIDGQFVYSKMKKLSATDHGLKIAASDQQAIEQWLIFKDSIIKK